MTYESYYFSCYCNYFCCYCYYFSCYCYSCYYYFCYRGYHILAQLPATDYHGYCLLVALLVTTATGGNRLTRLPPVETCH